MKYVSASATPVKRFDSVASLQDPARHERKNDDQHQREYMPAAVESCPAPMPDRISCSGRNSNSPSSAPVPSTAVAVCRNRSVCAEQLQQQPRAAGQQDRIEHQEHEPLRSALAEHRELQRRDTHVSERRQRQQQPRRRQVLRAASPEYDVEEYLQEMLHDG